MNPFTRLRALYDNVKLANFCKVVLPHNTQTIRDLKEVVGSRWPAVERKALKMSRDAKRTRKKLGRVGVPANFEPVKAGHLAALQELEQACVTLSALARDRQTSGGVIAMPREVTIIMSEYTRLIVEVGSRLVEYQSDDRGNAR